MPAGPYLLVLLTLLLALPGCQAVVPTTAAPAQTKATGLHAPGTAGTAAAAVAPTSPSAGHDALDGLPVGFTTEGYPFRGDPDAPITIHEYGDYQCRFCARHALQTVPALISSFVRTGHARLVFHDFSQDSLHPHATAAALAARCVAGQGAARFWRMHDTLFRTQGEWADLPDPQAHFAQLAGDAGADIAEYTACLSGSGSVEQVTASRAEGEARGIHGTPAFALVREATGAAQVMAGAQPYEVFESWLESLAAGLPPAPLTPGQEQDQSQGGIPLWAIAESWADDPDQPGINRAGDFWRGNPGAPVTVIEFSDFQCPACQSHSLETQPILDLQFVDTGEVRWIHRDFPQPAIHPDAWAAAGFARCVGRQGRFWEARRILFERVSEWVGPDREAVFEDIAAGLGIDAGQLAACRADASAQEARWNAVLEDSRHVQSTPAFFVIFNNRGRFLPGALPAHQFSELLTELVAEARAGQ